MISSMITNSGSFLQAVSDFLLSPIPLIFVGLGILICIVLFVKALL